MRGRVEELERGGSGRVGDEENISSFFLLPSSFFLLPSSFNIGF